MFRIFPRAMRSRNNKISMFCKDIQTVETMHIKSYRLSWDFSLLAKYANCECHLDFVLCLKQVRYRWIIFDPHLVATSYIPSQYHVSTSSWPRKREKGPGKTCVFSTLYTYMDDFMKCKEFGKYFVQYTVWLFIRGVTHARGSRCTWSLSLQCGTACVVSISIDISIFSCIALTYQYLHIQYNKICSLILVDPWELVYIVH